MALRKPGFIMDKYAWKSELPKNFQGKPII
jgi:hypothetical protein